MMLAQLSTEDRLIGLSMMNYRPQAWGCAVIAGFFTGASFMLAGVFWYALLG